MTHTVLSSLTLVVVFGWLAYFATSPTVLNRIHKLIAQTPLFFACGYALRVGNFHTYRHIHLANSCAYKQA